MAEAGGAGPPALPPAPPHGSPRTLATAAGSSASCGPATAVAAAGTAEGPGGGGSARIAVKKAQLRSAPRAKKLEKLGVYSACKSFPQAERVPASVKGTISPSQILCSYWTYLKSPLQSVEEGATEPPSCLGTYRKVLAVWSPTDSTSYLTTNRTLSRYLLKAVENKKKESGGGGIGGPRATSNCNATGKQLRKEYQKDCKNRLPPNVGVPDEKEETQPPVVLKKEGIREMA
ncbi:hypothetical protein STEG23_000403 [Scotinomys teguina]